MGIKSAVGEDAFWSELAHLMATTSRGVDFVTVDGGEGGTGAAPLVFTDHVAAPFKIGFARVYSAFAREDIARNVTFIGTGKLGFPEAALFAFALGCDMISVAREAMLAIGCVQAQICHTGRCPVGVATQSKWLARGVDPAIKSHRLAAYVVALRAEILSLSRTCGAPHPALVTTDHLEVVNERFGSDRPARALRLRGGMGHTAARGARGPARGDRRRRRGGAAGGGPRARRDPVSGGLAIPRRGCRRLE